MNHLHLCSYKGRVFKALQSQAKGDKKIMSIIIDGMDQTTCSLPHLGSQDMFSNPVKMGITGVKEHGVGLFLYRTVNTVKKGADLTIYCIHSQLEKFFERNGFYPEELYVQVDGGSENANKYVLASLEILVSKRVVRKIIFSRLPTGHTHEDIDACFGTISRCVIKFRDLMLTLDDFKEHVEAFFAESVMKCKYSLII